MGHGKETPRQKMIGMMYLVLTALLALNVSAEVLHAFVLVDKSLTKTGENFQKKNDQVYTDFQAAYEENKAKVAPYKDKADQVKIRTQELFEYIQGIKQEMVIAADGAETPYKESGNPEDIKKKDENNVPSEVMVLKGRGEELKKKIEEYRGYLLGMIDNKERYASVVEGLEGLLSTADVKGQEGTTKGWVEANFHQLPLAGATTMLSKLQTDVRNAEADILGYLFGQIDAGTFKFNKLEAIVNANSNYVLRGQEYKAEVFIAASDTTVEPQILVGGNPLPIKEGKGIYTGGTGSVGFKKWGGVIKIESPATGELLEYPFSAEYQVGETGVTVSPTKMNVFYIGVDNPVEISASGIPAESIRASISGGSIRKSGGGYIVKVKRPGEVTITVSAEVDGQTRTMGSRKFRVKRVPSPVAKYRSGNEWITGGRIKKNYLRANLGVRAIMENFDFDLTFSVVSFTVSTTIGQFEEEAKGGRGGKFNANQMALINKVRPGRKLYIENIKARGPDGSIRDLGSLAFRVE